MISQNKNPNMVGENNVQGIRPPVATESLIRILWRSRWFMLLSIIISLAMALLYLSKATPIYTSTSRIYVEQSGPRILTEVEGVMTQSKNYLYTQAELLKSTPILSSTLEKSSVGQMKMFLKVDNPIAYLKNRILNISVGRKDDIISISAVSPDPVETAHLVNSVVDSYITYHATRKRSTSAEILKILRSEKEKRSKELTESLKAMIDFRNEHEALALEGRQGNNVVNDQLDILSMSLIEAKLATIDCQSVYETTKEMVNDPVKLNQIIEAHRTTGPFSSIENERGALKSKLEQLDYRLANYSRQLAPNHPAIQAYKSDINHLKTQIAALDSKYAQAYLAVVEQEYLMAQEKEEQIRKNYDEQCLQAIDLNEQLAQYTMLQSDWEQTKRDCDILDDRIKELNVTEDVGALNISILETARPADGPSAPQKTKYMALALFIGIMLGGALTLLRDLMDQKLHSAEEISTILGVPVLGIVPSMSRQEDITERGRKVYLDSKSSWAEAYRTIRTAIFFGAPVGEVKTILVTSPAPSDGKTTLVSNLAITMAQAGQKTLILDGDFRKPMQHNIFGINHDNIGIVNVLAGTMALQEAIQSTNIKRLDILFRGPDVPNPSEILNSNSFAKVLKLLSNKYDRIILDSPPIAPVTDAQILAAICDITLLVLRAEKTTRKLSQQARDRLLSVGAYVLGTIVNDVSKKSRYASHGGHGGYYGYYGNDPGRHKKVSDQRTVAVI